MTYPKHNGVTLDPKVHTNPVTGLPTPILVLDVGGAPSTPPATEATLLQAANGINELVEQATYTPTLLRATAAGTANGASVTISNVGAANGTVLGAVLMPGETIAFDAPDRNSVLSNVAYNATGTEFMVATVTRSV